MKNFKVDCVGNCGRKISLGKTYCEVCVHWVFRQTEEGGVFIGERWEKYKPLNSRRMHRN